MCNVVFMQFVLPDLIRLLEYVRELGAVVNTTIKEFMGIFAENRMVQMMTYEKFTAINDKCPQASREGFTSCIEE